MKVFLALAWGLSLLSAFFVGLHCGRSEASSPRDMLEVSLCGDSHKCFEDEAAFRVWGADGKIVASGSRPLDAPISTLWDR